MKSEEKERIEGYANSILASKVMGDGVKEVAKFAIHVLNQKPIGFVDSCHMLLAKNWFTCMTLTKNQQPRMFDIALYYSPQVNTDWKLRCLDLEAANLDLIREVNQLKKQLSSSVSFEEAK